MNPTDRTRSFDDPLAGILEDQAARWAADAGPPAEEYLRRFPGLTDQDALAVIASEVVLRRRCGEHPDLAEYQARFPHLADALAMHFWHLPDAGSTRVADPGPAPTAEHDGAPAPGWPPEVPGYVLAGEVGRGGMGVVYRAEDTSLRRDVAVKILLDHYPAEGPAARRFVEEGRITGQLQHPGVPPVHQIGSLADGRPFLAMKLIKGRTLAEYLAAEADRGRFVAVFEKVCEAVAYAHARKVIHRDLKPANVMVGSFGEVQVMDWGLAKVLGEADREPAATGSTEPSPATEIRTPREPDSATQAGSVLGTPAFMPPEQAGGEVERIDERADVFGLGAVLCQILTGKPPYVGRDAEVVRLMAIRGRLVETHARLDGCGADPELVALAKRCLAAEPEERPRDAGEVAKAVSGLRAAAEERARRAEREAAAAEAREAEQRKRRRVQLLLAGAVGLIVLGAGAFAWWHDRQAADRKAERARAERDTEAAALRRQAEDDRRAEAEQARLARNGEAVAALLGRCEEALRADDARRALVPLEEAEGRVSDGGADHLRPRLARCRTDYDMLRALDDVVNLAGTWREGRFQGNTALGSMPQVLGRFGIALGKTPPADAARLINESLIRDRLLTVLDWWFAFELDTALERPLLAILRTADPDPFRDAFRAATAVGGSRERVLELADRPEVFDQPPRFAVVVGRQRTVPTRRREQLLRAHLVREPGNFLVLMALADLYPDDDDGVAGRIGWYQAAAVARPHNPVVWVNLGLAYGSLGEWHWAIKCYERAIEADKRHAIAHYNLGVNLPRVGRRDDAIASLRKAIELDPDYAPAHNNLGVELLKKGETEAAIGHFRRAIEIDPKYARAHYNLSLALAKKGEVIAASLALRAALKLDPKLETAGGAVDRARLGLPPAPQPAPPPRPVDP